MTYTCPVCGYNQLDEPAERHNICPSCGTQFDYSDDLSFFDGLTDKKQAHDKLRRRWISSGGIWWDEPEMRPLNWSPIEQLRNIHYEATRQDRDAITSAQGYTTGILALPENVFILSVPANLEVANASITIVPSLTPIPRNLRVENHSQRIREFASQ